MKIRIFVIVIITCMLGIVLLYITNESSFYAYIENYRIRQHIEKEYEVRHANMDLIWNLPELSENGSEWYCEYMVISHSGGGKNGLCYTNSKEAWEESYKKGNRIIDADMVFTTDSVLVLRHAWDDNMEQTGLSMKNSVCNHDLLGSRRYIMPHYVSQDLETFMSAKIHYLYTPQRCEDMINFMALHTDLLVAVDLKDENIIEGYKYLVEICDSMNANSILDRIIVSIYDTQLINEIKLIHPFRNYIIRQYPSKPHNYYELAKSCIDNDVHAVTVAKCYAQDEGVIAMQSRGIHIYVAVVDDIDELIEYRNKGYQGCVSNLIREMELRNVFNNFQSL